MAVVITEATSALKLRVQTGTTSAGSAKYSVRTISNISAALADEDAYAIGTALAALQTYPLDYVQKSDTAVLTENE